MNKEFWFSPLSNFYSQGITAQLATEQAGPIQ
jgi:hypothetical protein